MTGKCDPFSGSLFLPVDPFFMRLIAVKSSEFIVNILRSIVEFVIYGDKCDCMISEAVVGKLNKDTICLLAKVQEDVVVSFPLYTAAIKFACHEEQMIRIAVRALTLSIYNVRDDMVYEFMTTPPVSQYFSDSVIILREKCFRIDILVSDRKDTCTNVRMNELLREIDEVTDDLSYFKDVLNVGNLCLSKLLMSSLLSILVVPILLPSLRLNRNLESLSMSALTSLYILTRIVQIIGGQELVDTLGIGHKFPCGVLSYGGNMDFRAISSNDLSEIQKLLMNSLTPMHVIEENYDD
ncbi:hypothetical protein QJS10_CPA02g01048 [Acorus calamus]|uniref:FPL domain-containing protein n=1 Tax=Acorus calamus TaxID=4465 RepID=A0AAV9FEL0_ACOCL|nr:hypothetical protein QJS10_CPA02g01048 [Acorus calamus]